MRLILAVLFMVLVSLCAVLWAQRAWLTAALATVAVVLYVWAGVTAARR